MIYISHGEKGGLGKSRLAMALADLLLKLKREVVVVEGDKSGADVGRRFDGLVEVGYINLNRPENMEEAFSSLGGWLEEHAAGKEVVVNLPGQASDTLDQFAGLLADTAHLLGHDLTVFYSVGNLDLHTLNLVRSMREGLLSVVSVGRQVVVMPELFGPPAGYHWHQSPERQKFLAAGGKEGVMPRLKPDPLEQMIREIPGSYSALLEKSSPLKIADRALLFRWLAAAHAVATLGVNHD